MAKNIAVALVKTTLKIFPKYLKSHGSIVGIRFHRFLLGFDANAFVRWVSTFPGALRLCCFGSYGVATFGSGEVLDQVLKVSWPSPLEAKFEALPNSLSKCTNPSKTILCNVLLFSGKKSMLHVLSSILLTRKGFRTQTARGLRGPKGQRVFRRFVLRFARLTAAGTAAARRGIVGTSWSGPVRCLLCFFFFWGGGEENKFWGDVFWYNN